VTAKKARAFRLPSQCGRELPGHSRCGMTFQFAGPEVFQRNVHRRSFLVFAGTVCAAFWGASEVEAGVVTAWQQDPTAFRLKTHPDAATPWHEQSDFPAADAYRCGEGCSGSAERAAPSQPSSPLQIPRAHLIDGLRALAESTGSTSAPSNAGSSGGGTFAMMDRKLVQVALANCAFCYLRESVVRLPQPPLGELLDPPRSDF